MKTPGIYKISKYTYIIVLIHILFLGYPSLSLAILSPGTVYCNALGYTYLTEKTPLGDRGICQLPNGQMVDAQDFVAGKVALEWSYCAINGYEVKHVESSDLCKNCTICTLEDGSEVEVTILMQLSLEETTCNDGSCGIPENYSTCPEDCPSGGWDGYCDKVKDGIVDPDCDQFADPDELAITQITPQTLNCTSKGNWIKAHISLPTDVLVEQVDTSSPAVIENFYISSDKLEAFINDEGNVQLDASFNRSAVCSALEVLSGDRVELNVSARMKSGEYIFGKDTITYYH